MEKVVLTSEELKKQLDRNEIRFLFDLRNADEFAGWRIDGRSDIEVLNIPQPDFIGEEDGHLGKFPKDRRILTVCAHGDSSKYAAELLRERGYDAVTLEGGMDRWSEFYETHKASDRPLIFQIYRVARGCISHLIVSKDSAVVIDAVRHVDQILQLASSVNAKISHVFDTHLQADHISGGREIAARTGAVYHIHPADADGATYRYAPLVEGESFTFGSCTLGVIHTPGHTPGSTSFLLNNRYLFTGDTVMKTSLGRPDLGGKADEWASYLYHTVHDRMGKLADDIIILPSHAASIREQDDLGVVATTVGNARKTSELFQIKDKAVFIGRIKANLLENPERYQDIRKVNLGQLDPDEAKRKELEIGKNLCGMAKQ